MVATTDRKTDELFDQLMKIDGKAEIVNGEIVRGECDGFLPALAKAEILMALDRYARLTKSGRALGGTVAFRVDLPNRKSFCADAAYISQPRDGNMGPVEGAPVFAVEVRSENDYGPAADRAIAAKIQEYFAAGTLAVWDVDLQNENVVTLHLPDVPSQIFRRGDTSHAGAALPGWTMEVEEIFA